MENRPQRRQQNITGQGKSTARRGSGLGTGPVGSQQGYSGRPQGQTGQPQSSGAQRTSRAAGGRRSPILTIIIIAVLVLGGGGAGLGSLLGGGGTSSTSSSDSVLQQATQQNQQSQQQLSLPGASLSSLLGSFTGANVSTGWTRTANTGALDTSVASSARAKRTQIYGSGKDEVTIMVYMCGADLESRSGMATSDLQEMMGADLGSNVNLLVYTGGAKTWKNNIISNRTNQIYKVESNGLKLLEDDVGDLQMTKPATLTAFIDYCAKNYPANRNELIFWDHGGGSISGFGYDEKFTGAGSMNLKGIDEALTKSGITFDFIGFDACLMATVENALMLAPHADYLIASEETEPGVGWYYTNWLTKLAANTSMPTVEIGKNIADDFVSVCNQKCSGQKTTLSVVDLAELESTVPNEFCEFSSSMLELLQNDQYQSVSDARSGAREFAASSRIDQVDLVSLSYKLGTKEAEDLAGAILGAVKYNRTSSNMTDAYGLSVYFPYQKMSNVNNAVAAYEAIGMDEEYAKCIQKFASMEVSGQAVSGGSASPLPSLLGSLVGGTGSNGAAMSSDMISQMLGSLLGGNLGNVSGLTGTNSSFLGKMIDTENDARYLAEHQFVGDLLVWSSAADGAPVMFLSEEQWKLVHDLELNVFLDDGEGFIDLGLDNVFDFTDDGGLIGEYGGTWLAINGQPVAYYYTDTVYDGDDYTITGRVPAMLNGERVELILVFTSDKPYGYIAGASPVYTNGETETVAKNMLPLENGDVIDFLCDYYSYDGEYLDSYYLGDPLTVDGEPEISDVYIDADMASAVYRFTDIYNQQFWTPVLP